MQVASKDYFTSLPDEVLLPIVRYLTTNEMCLLALVSKRFKHFMEDEEFLGLAIRTFRNIVNLRYQREEQTIAREITFSSEKIDCLAYSSIKQHHEIDRKSVLSCSQIGGYNFLSAHDGLSIYSRTGKYKLAQLPSIPPIYAIVDVGNQIPCARNGEVKVDLYSFGRWNKPSERLLSREWKAIRLDFSCSKAKRHWRDVKMVSVSCRCFEKGLDFLFFAPEAIREEMRAFGLFENVEMPRVVKMCFRYIIVPLIALAVFANCVWRG